MASSLRHEGLFEHYHDDLIGYLKNFASYGWDGKADRQAEAYLQKCKEEMVLHYAGKDTLWQGLALGATESAVAVNIVTKEEIFRRFGDEDETPLQEENRAMIKDPNNTALIHNHWNDSPGSQADFDAALWLGVRYLIVVTPSGKQYIYEREGDTMKLLDEIFNREHVALPSPAETAESRAAYEAQALAEEGNRAERVMRQGEPSAVIEVSGSFRAYGNQWYAADGRDEPETFMEYDFTENPSTFRVLGRSTLNPSLVQIEVLNPTRYDVYRQWINLEDLGDKFRILGGDLESVPIKYARQSIVADEELDIELTTYPDWADRAKKGVLSRDLNPRGWPPPFKVQSPVIGPDVRVEYVVREDQVHKGLGNTVIISFPASVFLEDETLMQELARDPDHDPTQWREDGRIFYSFAHLFHIPTHIEQGSTIESMDKAIIGTTGNTGLINPETKRLYDDEHTNRHLDLIIVYFGSIDDNSGQMEEALRKLRPYQGTVNAFFGFAERSNLYLPDDDEKLSLYGENIDPVRVEPKHDELRRAQDENEKSIYSRE